MLTAPGEALDLDETVRLAEHGSLADSESADDFHPHDEGIDATEHAAPQYDAQQVR